MASNPPGACCVERSLHEGEAKGAHVDIFGLPTYQVGQENGNDRILIIVSDIHGFKFKNTLLLADNFAKAGYHVLLPDILKGDPVGDADLQTWLKSHTPEITTPIVDGFVTKVKSEYKPKTLVGVGYCFGAKYLIKLMTDEKPFFDSGAIAHPSFVTIEEVKAITKPILISAAEIDPIFTTELRHETEKALTEGKKTFQIDLFSGVSHGFTSRGDISVPHIKYAKEKAFQDQVAWFQQA